VVHRFPHSLIHNGPCDCIYALGCLSHYEAMKRGHAMKHEDIRWNQETLEWFCAKCGRTSGRIKKEDALAQLEEYKCELPTGESRRTPVDT
jgi:hypothetical protein